MNGNETIKTYPRTTDPVYNQSIEITEVTARSITVNVGKTLNTEWDVTNATYNTTSGDMELTIGSHSLTVGESIYIKPNSLTFNCGSGSGTYPRGADANTADGADYAYEAALEITAESATTITVNVNGGQGAISNSDAHSWAGITASKAVVSGGNYVHTFASALSDAITVDHGLFIGDRVLIEEDSLTFTCDMDNNLTYHTYPRKTDPKFNKWLAISNVTTNTFDVNVGTTTLSNFTPTAATYEPATGEMELTIGSHTLKQGATIKIADNSLTFTCSMDSNGSNHTYPRSTDPVSGASIPITGVTDTTININVGKSPLVKYNVTNATYNPTSGDMVLTIGTAHGLTAVSYTHLTLPTSDLV